MRPGAPWIAAAAALALMISTRGAVLANEPVAGTNLDFQGRSLFPQAWNALDIDPASDLAFVGFRRSVAVFDTSNPAQPALLATVDLADRAEGLHYPGSGSYLYAAAGDSGLVVIDVSAPDAPAAIGTTPTGDFARSVWTVGNRAYVANNQSGLAIYDVTDPAAAVLLGSADPAGLAFGVHIVGSLAYVAYAADGLHVIDVTDPANPLPLGSHDTPDYAFQVFVQGDLAYVADGFSGVQIVGVSDPAAPLFVGSYPGERVRDVRVVGHVAYVADREGGVLLILDVTVPSLPTLLGSLTTGEYPWRVRPAGGLAMLADDWGGLEIVDVSDPTSPLSLGEWRAARDAQKVFVVGRYAYVADGNDGLLVVDQIDLDAPRVVGTYPTSAVDVFVRDGLAYTVGNPGLQVFDLSDPTAPVLIGEVTVAARDVWVEGTFAYTADPFEILAIDVSDPSTPVVTGSHPAGTRNEDIVVRADVAYVPDGSNGLQTFDVSDPANIVLLGEADPDGPFDGDLQAVSVIGDWAYVADAFGEIEVYNVADPSDPRPNNQVPVAGSPLDLIVAGDTLYVASWDEGLRVYDLLFPNLPVEVAALDLNDGGAGARQGVGFRSGFAWIVDREIGGYIARWDQQCRDDFEPSDDFDLASAIDPDVVYSALICDQTDVDLYGVDVSAGGILDVTLTPPASRDYDLRVFDPWRLEIGASNNGPGAAESLSLTLIDVGRYFLEVTGAGESEFSSSEFYDLTYTFSACPAPGAEVEILDVALDAAGDIVLTIRDPNPAADVTGYNVYRSGSPSVRFERIATDVQDDDPGRPDVQYTDEGSAGLAPLYYLVAAYNGACGGEGPR